MALRTAATPDAAAWVVLRAKAHRGARRIASWRGAACSHRTCAQAALQDRGKPSAQLLATAQQTLLSWSVTPLRTYTEHEVQRWNWVRIRPAAGTRIAVAHMRDAWHCCALASSCARAPPTSSTVPTANRSIVPALPRQSTTLLKIEPSPGTEHAQRAPSAGRDGLARAAAARREVDCVK